MKLNNKGFAITGILYTLFILFLLILISILGGLSARRLMLEKSIEALETSYEGKDDNAQIKEAIETKKAPVTGKYVFNITHNFFKSEYTQVFDYKGEVQYFTVPVDGYYKIEAWGAQGGGTNGNGGKGGYTSGLIYLTTGETLYVYVGGKGGEEEKETKTNEGGWNGGGYSGKNPNVYSFGGGGATDIRYFSETPLPNDLEWNSTKGLDTRIMVAGGGGGTFKVGSNSKQYIINPGAGGNLIGGTGTGDFRYSSNNEETPNSGGGTQTRAGDALYTASIDKRGKFGSGTTSYQTGWGGGGGGGYYGGSTGEGKAGGGGSSYISGHKGCAAPKEKVFINTSMIAGDHTMPDPENNGTIVGKSGNGYAKITLIGKGTYSLYTYNGTDQQYSGTERQIAATEQVFTALKTGYYKIESWGAQGGGTNGNGGKGGYTSGIIKLISGQNLYIYAGEKGKEKQQMRNDGGWNGGGNSGSNQYGYSFGGGGATDIRYFGESTPSADKLMWNSILGLSSRIMVAGGGGGTFIFPSNPNNYTINPGVGGNLIGGTGTGNYTNSVGVAPSDSGGGTQIGPGIAESNTKKGTFGSGVTGDNNYPTGWGGGGGGGYWGGSTGHGKSGGGGSSYISGHLGCIAVKKGTNEAKDGCTTPTDECSINYSGLKFENTDMKSGNEYVPEYVGYNRMKGNAENGYAKITFLREIDEAPVPDDITCTAYIKKGTNLSDTSNITFVPNNCNNYTFTFDTHDSNVLDGNIMTLVEIYGFEE